jgi:hypothetical protein
VPPPLAGRPAGLACATPGITTPIAIPPTQAIAAAAASIRLHTMSTPPLGGTGRSPSADRITA